ncbi:putative Similar to chloride peroxidase and to hydrolase [Bradyrhizobium sp. STM 3843]|uniref:alpha/beta fold hydrolase n=1 Tax=Bradyrhizobium sp. STM 3843 TaxID=551947 RepID=UPI0002406C38|nr:alpha/beta hydrolase [Bradyrhizobium sp. STM 3843]CCE06218.1 putative Similar to chloride peroxidase and to hydrolase [Bradyrhizobium sp. STM 3843]
MQSFVTTSHGTLAVEQVGRGSLPLVLIHGNSTCRDVFRHQLMGRLAEHHRLIAFDLPGHGQSSDAPDPARTYTRSGLAEAVVELLERLDVTEAVVLGWSLGGHIGIEMVPRFAGMRGLMVIGTPPVARNGMADGFQRSAHMQVAGQEHLSETEIQSFVDAIFGKSAEPFMQAAVARADGRFRKTLFEAARAGSGVDQRQIVETSPTPLAVINGSDDRFVKLDYFDALAYANLWEGRCHRLAGLGHAPFWESPRDFDPILERFLLDIENDRARPC